MQGNHTRSSEFGFLEREQAIGKIDVATLQGQRLREAQPGSRQQPKERGIGCTAHTLSAGQSGRGGQQGLDLVALIDVRGKATGRGPEEAGAGDFCPRIKLQSISAKPAHHIKPPCRGQSTWLSMLGPCHGYCFAEVPVVTVGVGKASKR